MSKQIKVHMPNRVYTVYPKDDGMFSASYLTFYNNAVSIGVYAKTFRSILDLVFEHWNDSASILMQDGSGWD